MALKIGYRDYWSQGTIYGVSTQDPQFPPEDTQVDIITQSWRTHHGTGSGNGQFAVSATTKYIDFDEGGAEKTATLTPGVYNGTTLATHVQAQMVAAGTKAYTCAYDETTGLFTLTSPSGTFVIRWQSGTHTATSAAPVLGYSQAANDSGALTYVGDYQRFNTYEDIKNDLLSAVPLDMFAILGHNISSAATAITFYGADDAAFTTGVVTENVTSWWAAGNIYGFFSTPRTKRYWRFIVYDPANPNGYIEVGVIKLYASWTPGRPFLASYQPNEDSASTAQETGSRDVIADAKPVLDGKTLPFAGMSDADLSTVLDLQGVCDVLVNAFVIVFDDTAPSTSGWFVYLLELTVPVPEYPNYNNFTLVVRKVVQ
jgi:hypothetical protein